MSIMIRFHVTDRRIYLQFFQSEIDSSLTFIQKNFFLKKKIFLAEKNIFKKILIKFGRMITVQVQLLLVHRKITFYEIFQVLK